MSRVEDVDLFNVGLARNSQRNGSALLGHLAKAATRATRKTFVEITGAGRSQAARRGLLGSIGMMTFHS
jgi:hypothetical protein